MTQTNGIEQRGHRSIATTLSCAGIDARADGASRMHSRGPILLLPLLLLTACPGDEGPATPMTTASEESDSSTTSSPPATDSTTENTSPADASTTETDTSGTVAGCECILDQEPGEPDMPPSLPECGERTCPEVAIELETETDGMFDTAALECALMALRDRTPGLVTWFESENEGQYTDSGYVLVLEDGTAARRNWGQSDLSFVVSDAVHGELPPPEDFDACLAEPNDLVRFDCLRGALASVDAVCNEGWEFEGI